MKTSLAILDDLPEIPEFYDKYWNKRPFLLKGYLDMNPANDLISADELAGLSLEEDVRSRIVVSGENQSDWICEHGPFDEEKFSSLPEEKWSLLVQDVEKHHPQTSNLLKYFKFSPRWLIDDIMVSYSVPGGGVGPHLDSYHVFLVQGKGKRRWKIGNNILENEKYIQQLDLKILETDFDGEIVDVERGDVLYIPPKFPHSGETIKESMTFSIGFLGPSMAELLVEFGHHVEEQDRLNNRYDADLLDFRSAGDKMPGAEIDNLRERIASVLNSDHFENWIRNYFEMPED